MSRKSFPDVLIVEFNDGDAPDGTVCEADTARAIGKGPTGNGACGIGDIACALCNSQPTRTGIGSATLADVSYILRFHSDAGLTFPMIGQAVVVAGGWRVSYGTICAAVQLGLGNCQS